MKQIPLAIGPRPRPTFDSFIAGANAAALHHLRAPVAPSAPIYLWGPPGSGKTHLLRALAQRAPGSRASASAASTPPTPRRGSCEPDWTLVVIDRCDALDADAPARRLRPVRRGRAAPACRWVAAGRLPPVDLPLRDDLRTRLGWGHVFALQPLAEPQARAALRREADRRGIFLSDEVMDHLLTPLRRAT